MTSVTWRHEIRLVDDQPTQTCRLRHERETSAGRTPEVCKMKTSWTLKKCSRDFLNLCRLFAMRKPHLWSVRHDYKRASNIISHGIITFLKISTGYCFIDLERSDSCLRRFRVVPPSSFPQASSTAAPSLHYFPFIPLSLSCHVWLWRHTGLERSTERVQHGDAGEEQWVCGPRDQRSGESERGGASGQPQVLLQRGGCHGFSRRGSQHLRRPTHARHLQESGTTERTLGKESCIIWSVCLLVSSRVERELERPSRSSSRFRDKLEEHCKSQVTHAQCLLSGC